MKRQAFTMQLLPDCEEEYKKRHDEIWPELETLLKESGFQNYSIFLQEPTGTLFAYYEYDGELADLSEHPLMRRWWSYMQDLMKTHPDDAPVVESLREVFHLA